MKRDYRIGTADRGSGDLGRYWAEAFRGHTLGDAARVAGSEEARLSAPFLEALPRGAAVLDGGCGVGGWPRYLAGKGLAPVGLDISDELISRLRASFPECAWQVGDVAALSFSDASFDAYLAFGVFEHFPDGLQRPLREARRVLRPQGRLVVTVPFQNLRHLLRDRRPFETEADARQATTMVFYQWRLTAAELRRELAIAGFQVDLLRPIQKREGMRRLLRHDLHCRGESRWSGLLERLLSPCLPASWVSHMLLSVATRT